MTNKNHMETYCFWSQDMWKEYLGELILSDEQPTCSMSFLVFVDFQNQKKKHPLEEAKQHTKHEHLFF